MTAWRWSPPTRRGVTAASREQSERGPAGCVRQTQSQVINYLQRQDKREESQRDMRQPGEEQAEGNHRVYLLGLMDSRGTKTSVRVTSGVGGGGGGGASAGVRDISSSVAPTLGWELWKGSEGNAGIGLGATLEPDLFWRSLRVGLDCCLSLIKQNK